jgi:hypothetical protein
MKRILLAGALALGLPLGAHAQGTDCITDPLGNTFCDPTALHVTGAGAGATQDPVVIKSNTGFTISDNSGASIDKPLTIYAAVPIFSGIAVVAPSISKATFDGTTIDAVTGPTLNPKQFVSGDLYTFVGCVKCDNSLTFGNLVAAEQANHLGTPTGFDVFTFTIQQGFGSKADVEAITGTFTNGTIIAPLAADVVTKNGKTTTTYYDTSWTNAGFLDGPPPDCTGPNCTTQHSVVPEPSTLAILGLGVLGLGVAGRRRL